MPASKCWCLVFTKLTPMEVKLSNIYRDGDRQFFVFFLILVIHFLIMNYWMLVCLVSCLVVGSLGKPQHRHQMSPILNGTSTEDNDDIDCIEVEALKEWYCMSQKCKDFFVKTCYDVVNNTLPTCASVKRCFEDRTEQFMNKAEKWHTSHTHPNSAAIFSQSWILLVLIPLFSVVNMFTS